MRAAIAIAAFLVLLGVALFLFVASGLFFTLIILLGIFVFGMLLAGIAIFAILLIVAVPYYFLTKRAETVPGDYPLDQIREE